MVAHARFLTRRKPNEIYQAALAEVQRYQKLTENQGYDDVDLFHYNKLTQNCEHFVTECSYGEPFSYQTDTMYTYWTKQAHIDFKTFILIFEFFSLSIIRYIVTMIMKMIFTDAQLEKIVSFISTALTDIDDAINNNVTNYLMERIWVYVPLYILFKIKIVLIDIFIETRRICRMNRRNALRQANTVTHS